MPVMIQKKREKHPFYLIYISFTLDSKHLFFTYPLISSISHWSSSSVFLSLHLFEYFLWFSFAVVSSFIHCCCERYFDMISVCLNLLRLVLNLWSILENVPEKNVNSAVRWSILYVLVRYNWPRILFKSSVPLIIFHLVGLWNMRYWNPLLLFCFYFPL